MNARKFNLVNNENAVVAAPAEEGFLIPVGGIAPGQYGTDEIFDIVSKAGGYLPRVQLFGGNSDAVKEGKIPMAHYGLVRGKDQIEDLGPVVNLIPISWRSKAMRLLEGNVRSVFNPNNPEFRAIMEESEEKDSKCLFGPEYLVWLLDQKIFATFLMGSKTSRRESRNLKPLLGKAATLKIKLVSNKNYKWHSPMILPYSMPVTKDSLPPDDKIREEADKFNNPEETEVEVEDAAVAARDR
jgi:hypothetical protein